MTDPSAAPPPPPPGPVPDQPGKKPADRRKRVAIGINVVLFLGIVTVIVMNGRDSAETPVEAEAAGSAVSTTEATDESDAFVTGIQPASIPTTTSVPAPGGGDLSDGTTATAGADGDGESSAMTTSRSTSTTSTTTEPDGPPVLSGEIDDDGIPVGLEFPLFNSEHTIIGGENLWLIAANQLAAITERPLEDVPQAQIAVYWDRVIDTNRGTLRSGDPNLVYPGEIVRFPGA